MPCLVCENRIPLRRQLAGNRFCSDEHAEEYAASQKSLAIARLSAKHDRPRLEPLPAQALQGSDLSPFSGVEAGRMFRDPIPRFSDVKLGRGFFKPRFIDGLTGAKGFSAAAGAPAP